MSGTYQTSREDWDVRDDAWELPPGSERSYNLVQVARILLMQIRTRDEYLPTVVFEDPQWSMILDLFIAGETGRKVPVSDLCAVSGVPATTALRHINWLEENDVIRRSSCPADRRRSYLALTEATHRRTVNYLLSVITSWIEVSGNGMTAGEVRELYAD